jgi:hypothetical protein
MARAVDATPHLFKRASILARSRGDGSERTQSLANGFVDAAPVAEVRCVQRADRSSHDRDRKQVLYHSIYSLAASPKWLS